MKALKIVWKVFKIFLITIVCLVLAYNMLLLFDKVVNNKNYPTAFGLSSAVVITGSMQPEIMVGDMVVVCQQKDYQIDDVITFRDNEGKTITHKIVKRVDNANGTHNYKTMGIATGSVDPWVLTEKDIYGKVVCVIPGMGNIIDFFKTPGGIISLFLIIGLFFVLPVLFEKEVERDEKEQAKKREEIGKELEGPKSEETSDKTTPSTPPQTAEQQLSEPQSLEQKEDNSRVGENEPKEELLEIEKSEETENPVKNNQSQEEEHKENTDGDNK